MPATGAAAQQSGRALRWFMRTRDSPELMVLGGLIGGVAVLASYTIKKTLLNNEAGSYPSITLRGDAFKQVETGRVGLEDASTGKHSWLWHVAQYKIDEDGANIGVLFDNRVRPHQYSKPGAGMGGGVSLNTL